MRSSEWRHAPHIARRTAYVFAVVDPNETNWEPVLDFAKNQLTKAENYVEPIRPDDTFIYSNTILFVCGLPNLKKGFRRNFSFWFQGSEKRTYLKTLYRIKNPMLGFEIG